MSSKLDNQAKSNKPFIFRDTREHEGNGWIFDKDKLFAGTQTMGLKTGDYTVETLETKLCIERKGSLTEFVQNLIQKRFQAELKRMMEFEYRHVVLEFSAEDLMRYPHTSAVPYKVRRSTKMTGSFLFKRTIEFQMAYGIHFWFAGTCGKSIAKSLIKRTWESEYGSDLF